MCFVGAAFPEERGSEIRARLLATPLETKLTLELGNGQEWKGTLIELMEAGAQIVAEPDKRTRKRLGLGSGMKLKKVLPYDDIVALEGALNGELLEKYLVLEAAEPDRMRVRLAVASAGGFRLLAGAGRRTVILERSDSGGPFEYTVPSDVRDKREQELDEWGAQGFYLVPGTIGAWFNEPSALLERAPWDASRRDYRVLEMSQRDTMERELLGALREGFRLVGITASGKPIALLEAVAASDTVERVAREYRLLQDFESMDLDRAVRDRYRLVACSDGELLCVFEQTPEGLEDGAYRLLVSSRISTLEKELNEAGRSGYRVHSRALGVQEALVREIFVIIEKAKTSAFEYRIISARGASEIQERVARAAVEGFRVVAMTSETDKTGSKQLMGSTLGLVPGALGATLGAAWKMSSTSVLVVMERPLRER
jgi:hypothetical protein